MPIGMKYARENDRCPSCGSTEELDLALGKEKVVHEVFVYEDKHGQARMVGCANCFRVYFKVKNFRDVTDSETAGGKTEEEIAATKAGLTSKPPEEGVE